MIATPAMPSGRRNTCAIGSRHQERALGRIELDGLDGGLIAGAVARGEVGLGGRHQGLGSRGSVAARLDHEVSHTAESTGSD